MRPSIWLVIPMLLMVSDGHAQGPLSPGVSPSPSMKTLQQIYDRIEQLVATVSNQQRQIDYLAASVGFNTETPGVSPYIWTPGVSPYICTFSGQSGSHDRTPQTQDMVWHENVQMYGLTPSRLSLSAASVAPLSRGALSGLGFS